MKEENTSLTQGCIWKSILLFAFPMFLGNLFQQLYNTADSMIVGNFAGSEALAAVSSSGSLIFLMVGFFNGIAVGAGVIIAKFYGAKDYKNLKLAIHTNLAFSIVAGVVLTIIGIVLTPHILQWMGTPKEVLPNSILYFRIYFLGSTAVVLYNSCMGILQAVGDSKHPLYYLIFSSIMNVILDLLFVGVCGFGVGAAALATVISQAISVWLCLHRLTHVKEVYTVVLKEIWFTPDLLKKIIDLGLPAGLQNSIISIANVVVQANINAFGKDAVAGCGTYFKIEGFGFLPITCFAMAMTTFVGQNLGAREYARAKKGAAFGMIVSPLLAEVTGTIIFLFAPVFIRSFGGNEAAVAFGVQQSHTECLFYFLLAFSHCVAGIMRGAGKSKMPMYTMLAIWCVFRITYITLAVRFVPKIGVIFYAYPLTWFLSSIIFLIYFLKADWVHNFERMEI